MARCARTSAGLAALLLSSALLLVLAQSPMAEEAGAAGGQGGLDGTEAVIELLRQKGVITQEEADRVLERLQGAAPPAAPSGAAAGASPAAPAAAATPPAAGASEGVAQGTGTGQAAAEPQTVGGLARATEWARRIQWGGDIRLRYEGDFFDKNNALLLEPSDPMQLMNTREDRNRGRVRARLFMDAQVNDNVEFEARLSTGNEDDPVSTNQTLGKYWANFNVVFDQLFLRWLPAQGVSVALGRIPNPWVYSDLVWDPDLNFDGLVLTGARPLGGRLSGFFTAGVFPLQEVEFSSQDKWMYAGQIGVSYKPFRSVTCTLGVAYYSYQNITGQVNDPLQPGEKDWTAPEFQQKGNTLMDIDPSAGIKTALASDFDELDVVATLDIGIFHPVHVVFLADYVNNLGFDREDVAERAGNPDLDSMHQGYQIGLTVGHSSCRRFGTWNTSLFYKCLEADAVLDAFTDSDFHLGGTNAKGWVLGGELGLGRNVWVRARWLSSDEVDGPPLAIDTVLVDLNAAF